MKFINFDDIVSENNENYIKKMYSFLNTFQIQLSQVKVVAVKQTYYAIY